MKNILLILSTVFCISVVSGQNISSELIEIKLLKQPKVIIDQNSRQLNVTVTSPYNITAEGVIAKSKLDFEQSLKNYDKDIIDSERQYNDKLRELDRDDIKAKAKFDFEMDEFKRLSIIERMAMTDQGKNPRLVTSNKPQYYKPQLPVYQEPNLNDYNIVDNKVLSSRINIAGFAKEGSFIDVLVDIQAVNFQDTAGQTYANQPTKIIVKVNGIEKQNAIFFKEFKFIASSPSNNINKSLEEKNHLNNVIIFVNQYLNDNYGFQTITRSVKINKVKNKGSYDDLEKAHIYVTTNLKKLQPVLPEENTVALQGLKKGTDIWLQTLEKIDFKDSKSGFNAKIAEFIYINFIRLNLALGNKTEAEKFLNQYQENQIYMKLSYDDKNELDTMEKEIYKK